MSNPIQDDAAGGKWELVVGQAAFSPRDCGAPLVHGGKMWLSNGYYHGRHASSLYVYEGSLWMAAGNTWPVVNEVWRLTLPGEPGQ